MTRTFAARCTNPGCAAPADTTVHLPEIAPGVYTACALACTGCGWLIETTPTPAVGLHVRCNADPGELDATFQKVHRLIAASSLGTPDATAARATVTDQQAKATVQRAEELRDARLALDGIGTAGGCVVPLPDVALRNGDTLTTTWTETTPASVAHLTHGENPLAADQPRPAAHYLTTRARDAITSALNHLPATCPYHGSNLDREGSFGPACCDTGAPALARRRALDALTNPATPATPGHGTYTASNRP